MCRECERTVWRMTMLAAIMIAVEALRWML